MNKQLNRTTFSTSRLLDFANRRELAAQTGHAVDEWPLVIVKELVDNALDAAEEAGTAPVIAVTVDERGISVCDNGPGLPATTIASILDFTTRTSSREAYVSPTRGAQGNALLTLIAMPFALHGERGEVEIGAHGQRHGIGFRIDHIRQAPVIEHAVGPDATCKEGTEFRVRWPDCACSILADAEAQFLQIADDFGWFNPHLTLTVDWLGQRRVDVRATNPGWLKWKPSDPTSAHWYTPERFARLIAAYVADDADKGRVRLVREFVAEFRGLSATSKGKAVLASVGLAREPLSALAAGGRIDADRAGLLLAAMQEHSKPVKPAQLGVIGRQHFEARFAAAGCQMESFDYKKVADCDEDGLPCVIEVGFGWLGDAAEPERRLVSGLNWSASVRNPFRSLGGFGRSLDTVLANQWCDADEPVIVAVHVAHPRIEFVDRGKTAVVLSMRGASILNVVEAATGKWAKQRKQEERDAKARHNRVNVMVRRARHVSIKEAAWSCMAQAYRKASAGDTLPAHARQVMYAARPYIQANADRDLGSRFDQYFTQTLLPEYVEAYGVDWNVVYDARGHFHEPHTDREVALGTLDVRGYVADVSAHEPPEVEFKLADDSYPTCGPRHRFGALMFVEKEGFMPLFAAVKLAERYDLGIMSTKGMSVTAARELVEEVCGPHGIPLLVLHDFDKSGLSIAGTLQRDTRRYAFTKPFEVHDLGFRLDDIGGLATEDVAHQASDAAVADNLRLNGATKAEIEFLLHRRVELNAMASDQLGAFIEAKLKALGIAKVVPDDATLQAACARARAVTLINDGIDDLVAQAQAEVGRMAAIDDLAGQVRALLEREPALPWDAAVARIVAGNGAEGEP